MARADGHTQGSDAMDLAARKYHVNVVRALVRAGADPTLPIDGGKSALEMMPGASVLHLAPLTHSSYVLKLLTGCRIGRVTAEVRK